ncbi:MAG: putative Nucleoside-diphosphate-sugar epimerase [Promethearchaeota archaeon]|nr:MAG: putative Nucleoside-diphosphate-sugar epimerase [Candidatus Lokiarchaeota archaeon]
MKLALVDGALGHTGSFLVKYLIEDGWEVIATDLDEKRRNKIMTKEKLFNAELKYLDCREWPNVKYIPADLTKKDTLEDLFTKDLFETYDKKNYDVVFHPASLYDYGASYDLLHSVNYEGLKNLLDIMLSFSRKTKSRIPKFIHWSTCGVYGEPNYQKDEDGIIYPTDESAPYNPPNNYSQSKVEQEKLIFTSANNNPNFKYIILRPAPIYGPYQTYGMYHIFYTAYVMGHSVLVKIFPKKRKLMMPMIHVVDLVRAAIFLSKKDEVDNEIFNIINDSPLQEQFMQMVYKETDITFSTLPLPWILYRLLAKFTYFLARRRQKKAKEYGTRPTFDLPMVGYLTHQYYFSNKKLKDLGFEFFYNDFKKGVSETISWYKENGWFPFEDLTKPEYVNEEPREAYRPTQEYKTPMEGGEIF